jgi:hypothetical protein
VEWGQGEGSPEVEEQRAGHGPAYKDRDHRGRASLLGLQVEPAVGCRDGVELLARDAVARRAAREVECVHMQVVCDGVLFSAQLSPDSEQSALFHITWIGR